MVWTREEEACQWEQRKEEDSKYILEIEFIGPAVGKEEDLRGRGKGKENSGVSPE